MHAKRSALGNKALHVFAAFLSVDLLRGLSQSLRPQGRAVIMGSSIAPIATPLHVDYFGRVSCYILTLEILLMAISSIPKCLIYLGSH